MPKEQRPVSLASTCAYTYIHALAHTFTYAHMHTLKLKFKKSISHLAVPSSASSCHVVPPGPLWVWCCVGVWCCVPGKRKVRKPNFWGSPICPPSHSVPLQLTESVKSGDLTCLLRARVSSSLLSPQWTATHVQATVPLGVQITCKGEQSP